MKHLIDKAAVVAEMKKLVRKNELYLDDNVSDVVRYQKAGVYSVLNDLLHFLDTLEVKEVDLEKELDSMITPELKLHKALPSLFDVAKHFFELGMRVNNPITAADRGTAEEVIINLKRIESDYRINLTKEIEWVRNKVKKGEKV